MMRRKYIWISIFLILTPLYLTADDDLIYWKKPQRIYNFSYLGATVSSGFSSIIHSIPNTQAMGGGFGSIGLKYQLKNIETDFIFTTGGEITFLNSATRLDNFTMNGIYEYRDPSLDHSIEMEFQLDFFNYIEQHNFFALNTPILFGRDFRYSYICGGVNFLASISSHYITHTNIRSSAYDPEIIGKIENVPDHYFSTYRIKTNGNLNFYMDGMATLEYGILLDKWIHHVNRKSWGNVKPSNFSYRLGMFASCGIYSFNTNPKNQYLVYYGNTTTSDDVLTFPLKDVTKLSNSSIFTTSDAVDKPLRTLMLGIKFSVLFQQTRPCVHCTY